MIRSRQHRRWHDSPSREPRHVLRNEEPLPTSPARSQRLGLSSRGGVPVCCGRALLPAVILSLLTAGCSMPGKLGNLFAGNANQNEPVRTASYQQEQVEVGPPKKIKDPVALKLRYAKWMEEIRNYPEAVSQYQVVLQERPGELDALLGLARIDQAANRMEAAEAGYKQAVAASPDSPAARHALGQFYAAQERWSEALPLLSDAVQGVPANKSYRFDLAVALAGSGDYRAAYSHFEESVGDVVAHYNLGMILKSQGQYRQAEQQFLQALTKKPDFEEARQAVAEVRQLAQSSGTYAAQPAPAPQIQPTSHQQPHRQVTQQPHRQVTHQPVAVPAQTVIAPSRQQSIPAQPVIAPRGQRSAPAQPVIAPSHSSSVPARPAMAPASPQNVRTQPTLTPRQQEQLRNQRALQQ